jgi:Yip1 domain
MNDPDFDPYLPPRAPVGTLKTPSSMTIGLDGNPWLTIWTQPRATIRGIIDTDPTRNVAILAVLSGISRAIDQAAQNNLGDKLPMMAILIQALIGGAIGGLIGLYLAGWMLRWVGSMFGGQGTSQEVRAALAWSSVPVIGVLILWIPIIVVFGGDFFRAKGLDDVSVSKAPLLLGFGAGVFVFVIWNIVLLVKTLAEAHKFSSWKALGTIIAAFLIIFIPLVILIIGVVGIGQRG